MTLNLLEIVRVSSATYSSRDSVDSSRDSVDSSRDSVDSSCDSVDSLSLRLTFFDLRWIKFHPTQRLIFFKVPEASRDFFDSKIVPKLKLSLSHVLRHYLPLLGSIKWGPQDPKPNIIASKNDTVSLTVAETNADFSHVSGNELRLAIELHPLVPELTVSDDSASIISIQITLFPNQGFSIGITSHHAVIDAATESMFIKSWAHICRSQQYNILPEDLTPRFDRTVINLPPRLETKMMELVVYLSPDKENIRKLKPHPMSEISADVVRVTLELTREDIEKLRERVRNEPSRSPFELQHLSTFVIAYAYALTCVVKARGCHANTPVNFLYVADMRHRLNPRVPASYFGNCLFPIGWFEYEARVFLEKHGFVNAVEILNDSVKGLESRGIETLLQTFVEGTKRVKPGAPRVTVAGTPGLGLYEVDFGWGRPSKTEVVSIDRNEAFSMSKRRDETGGVEIGVCLKNSEMNIFLSIFKSGFTKKSETSLSSVPKILTRM